MARPVSDEVQCPRCGRRSRAETSVAPTSEIAEARARSEQWTCLQCGHQVVAGNLVRFCGRRLARPARQLTRNRAFRLARRRRAAGSSGAVA